MSGNGITARNGCPPLFVGFPALAGDAIIATATVTSAAHARRRLIRIPSLSAGPSG
jgi:hypothetical protein